MDRICLGDLGRGDDVGNVEIALGRFCRPYADGFVGEHCVERGPVGLGIDCYSLNLHLSCRTDDSECNFPSVCDQDLGYHGRSALWPDGKKLLAVLDRLAVLDIDLLKGSFNLSLDLVHQLHGFDDTEGLVLCYYISLFYEGRR